MVSVIFLDNTGKVQFLLEKMHQSKAAEVSLNRVFFARILTPDAY